MLEKTEERKRFFATFFTSKEQPNYLAVLRPTSLFYLNMFIPGTVVSVVFLGIPVIISTIQPCNM